jgi:hypothetical protein
LFIKIRKFGDLRCDCADEIGGICMDIRVTSGSLLIKPSRVGVFSWKLLKSIEAKAIANLLPGGFSQ